MDPPQDDPFLALLTKRQRNLRKRLQKIRAKSSKQGELEQSEREMLNSQHIVEALLGEIERILEKYCSGSQAQNPSNNEPCAVADLWLLGNFLSHPETLQKFTSATGIPQDFLSLHSVAKGAPGKALTDIISNTQHQVVNCLKNSKDTTNQALDWCMGQTWPQPPQKLPQKPPIEETKTVAFRAPVKPQETNEFIEVTKKKRRNDEGFERVESKKKKRQKVNKGL